MARIFLVIIVHCKASANIAHPVILNTVKETNKTENKHILTLYIIVSVTVRGDRLCLK